MIQRPMNAYNALKQIRRYSICFQLHSMDTLRRNYTQTSGPNDANGMELACANYWFQIVQSRLWEILKTILKISYAKCWDVSCPIWQACPALPGPISANGVEFRFTVGYLLNSFFGRFWQAKMKKRSKFLNPRAAACANSAFLRSIGRSR